MGKQLARRLKLDLNTGIVTRIVLKSGEGISLQTPVQEQDDLVVTQGGVYNRLVVLLLPLPVPKEINGIRRAIKKLIIPVSNVAYYSIRRED